MTADRRVMNGFFIRRRIVDLCFSALYKNTEIPLIMIRHISVFCLLRILLLPEAGHASFCGRAE